jgi:uncharacterized protein (DUF1684 family)
LTEELRPGQEGEPRASLSLWDYRRRVSELYTNVRALEPEAGWRLWASERDDLFKSHPDSPIPPDGRDRFSGLPYFPYDASMRVTARIEPADPHRFALPHSGDGSTEARVFGTATFVIAGSKASLDIFWLDQYGGGVFLPFKDASNGSETYGGGRYLLDTAKGADLGSFDNQAVLDFNFAYHPSCVHDSRWSCPLAPPGNRLESPILAGERLP